jgi:CubicO group peptidase (beta-lactamase class C family)
MEYDALFSVDSKRSGFEYMPSRLIARAVDYARFGRLFLNEGNWNGEQLISKQWVRESVLENTTVQRDFYPEWLGSGCKRTYYTYQWWGHTNCDSSFQFFATGNLGQTIYIIPDEDIIIVHCGNSLEYYNEDILWHVADLIRSGAYK